MDYANLNNSATEQDTAIFINFLTQNQLYIQMMSILKIYPKKWWKSPKIWYFVQILPYLQCAQTLISVNSLSCAEENSTNHFVITCTVVEILLCSVRSLIARRLWFYVFFEDQHKCFNWSSVAQWEQTVTSSIPLSLIKSFSMWPFTLSQPRIISPSPNF